MVRNVLQLIESARIEHDEPKHAADPLIEPRGAEHRPVAEFMLAGVQKVQQHALDHEQRYGPGTEAQLPQEKAGEDGGAEVRGGLYCALEIGGRAQPAQRRRINHLPPDENLLHEYPVIARDPLQP